VEEKEQSVRVKDQQFEEGKEQVISSGIFCLLLSYPSGIFKVYRAICCPVIDLH